MQKILKQFHAVIFIKTSKNNTGLIDQLIEETTERHVAGEQTTIFKISKIYLENDEMSIDHAAEIVDLIETTTEAFYTSSVYIHGEPQHYEIITRLINENPFEGDVEIKVIDFNEYVQIHPSI